MASIKSTFTLDPQTVARLAATAERLNLSKSAVVREAILDYSERADGLGERERRRLLGVFDELVPRIPERPLEQAEAEIDDVRAARRTGGRRRSGERR